MLAFYSIQHHFVKLREGFKFFLWEVLFGLRVAVDPHFKVSDLVLIIISTYFVPRDDTLYLWLRLRDALLYGCHGPSDWNLS